MIIRFSKSGLCSLIIALAAWVVPLGLLATAQTPITCTATKQGGNGVLISWNTVAGKVYTLESKTTVTASWESGAELAATNGSLSLTVPIEAGTRFFRVVEGELNPVPPGMVAIPAGTFQMGDSFGEGNSNELPVHVVSVSAFCMDKYEVTKALWDEVYTWALDYGYQFDNPGLGKGLSHPVHTVSWYDMVKWCNARSEREGRIPAYYTSAGQTVVYRTGQVDVEDAWVKWDRGYRLPTEAEWEYAARGGLSGKRFPWGDTITHSEADYCSDSSYTYDVSPTRGYHPEYATGGEPYTSPVGSFGANGYGLYDMSGNIWERCWDWYGDYESGAQTNPRGPAAGSQRVFRGGCWYSRASYCRVTARSRNRADDRNIYDGFRCVLLPGPSGMALIPAGTFQMGDSLGDGWSDELAVHTVTVSGFYMDRTEVTKALWKEVYGWARTHGYSFDSGGSGKGATHPVHTVNWYDMVKWCNARSEREGRVPAYYTSAGQTVPYRTGQINVQNEWVKWGRGYRLPTEAEWEYGARGGLSGRRFPWGDTISHSQANYSSSSSWGYDVSPTRGYHPTYATDETPYTSPVGSFGANGYGLYDMAGNVWEWCWDWYSSSYSSTPAKNPRGPTWGSGRVSRGGGWYSGAWNCRVTFRIIDWPDYGDSGVGFRSVLPSGQ